MTEPAVNGADSPVRTLLAAGVDTDALARTVSAWVHTCGGVASVGTDAAARAMFELRRPELDWVELAADSMERFNDLLANANARPGRFLIEAVR